MGEEETEERLGRDLTGEDQTCDHVEELVVWDVTELGVGPFGEDVRESSRTALVTGTDGGHHGFQLRETGVRLFCVTVGDGLADLSG